METTNTNRILAARRARFLQYVLVPFFLLLVGTSYWKIRTDSRMEAQDLESQLRTFEKRRKELNKRMDDLIRLLERAESREMRLSDDVMLMRNVKSERGEDKSNDKANNHNAQRPQEVARQKSQSVPDKRVAETVAVDTDIDPWGIPDSKSAEGEGKGTQQTQAAPDANEVDLQALFPPPDKKSKKDKNAKPEGKAETKTDQGSKGDSGHKSDQSPKSDNTPPNREPKHEQVESKSASKILVYQIKYFGNEEYADASIDNHRLYSKLHGYDYELDDPNKISKDRPPSWHKIAGTLLHLASGKYKWVCYFDLDTVITRLDQKLETYLEGPEDFVVARTFEYFSDDAKDHEEYKINMGVWCLRNSEWSTWFFNIALNQTQFLFDKGKDNLAVRKIVKDRKEIGNHVKYVDEHMFNVHNWRWREGDFVIHYYGGMQGCWEVAGGCVEDLKRRAVSSREKAAKIFGKLPSV
mmetsp:Transcript_8260/g.13434  ORF Transcript_8260/g.13434 Transcript_8260/m.13434 type:complete len:467 (-) Transcript_8260:89-1489(-)